MKTYKKLLTVMLFLGLCLGGIMVPQRTAKAASNGWEYSGGYWYYYSSGVKQTGWEYVGGKWYYMDASGRMQTGWAKVGSTWYYMNGSGAMTTGWQCVGGKWYYMNGSGAMTTGWQRIGGTWYYMNGSGVMTTGWQRVGGTWYYMNGSGAMQNARWQYIGSNWYCFAPSGAMLTGWQKTEGFWFYMDASGRMQTGWQKLGGKWYYLGSTGEMYTGWHTIGGTKYYFNESGVWQENTGSNNTNATEVGRLVNAERAKAGLPALQYDANIERAANIRAKEIAVSFEHKRLDGTEPWTAMDECGVSYSWAGENIAAGYGSPTSVMNGWMNSAGHRANILRSQFGRIGVGYYVDSSGRAYWVQLFAD